MTSNEKTPDSYTLNAECKNCRWRGTKDFEKGRRPVFNGICPHCGCETVWFGCAPEFEVKS